MRRFLFLFSNQGAQGGEFCLFENVSLNGSFPTSETIQRDFSPVNQRNVYDPFGRPGAGAPIKDPEGQIQTRTAGKVVHDASVSMAVVRGCQPHLQLLDIFLLLVYQISPLRPYVTASHKRDIGTGTKFLSQSKNQ